LVLEVECGSGTYIRSLVRDIGEVLGCGAHVEALRRLWVAPFREPAMHTLDALQAMGGAERDACLLSLEAGLAGHPWLRLDDMQARRLGAGQRFRFAAAPGAYVAGDAQGRALGLVDVDADGLLRARRMFRWAAAGA